MMDVLVKLLHDRYAPMSPEERKDALANLPKGLAASTAGQVGDMAYMLQDLARYQSNPAAVATDIATGDILDYQDKAGSTDWLGKLLGADIGSAEYVAGTVGVPDIRDVGSLMGKGIGAIFAGARHAGRMKNAGRGDELIDWGTEPISGERLFEISDDQASLKGLPSSEGASLPLNDVLDHEVLRAASGSDLDDIKVMRSPGKEASWDSENRVIGIGTESDDPLSDILHEVNHSVMEDGGLPSGANAAETRRDYSPAQRELHDAVMQELSGFASNREKIANNLADFWRYDNQVGEVFSRNTEARKGLDLPGRKEAGLESTQTYNVLDALKGLDGRVPGLSDRINARMGKALGDNWLQDTQFRGLKNHKSDAKKLDPSYWESTPFGQSSKDTVDDFAFLSAERTGLSPEENAQRTDALQKILEERFPDAGFRPVSGRYGGVDEASFALEGIGLDQYDEIIDIAKQFDQESILTPRGLIYTTGDNAGKYHPLKSKLPQRLDSETPDNFSQIAVKDLLKGETDRKFSYDIDWDKMHDVPLGQDISEHLTSQDVQHFSRALRERLDPKYAGTASAGDELRRVQRGEQPEAVYGYIPEDMGKQVRPEPSVFGKAHVATFDDLYDVDSDPAGINPFTLNNADRLNLLKRMGAGGVRTEALASPAAGRVGSAVSFNAVDAQPLDVIQRMLQDNPDVQNKAVLDVFADFDPRFDGRVKEQARIRNTTRGVESTQGANPKVKLSDFEGHPFVLGMSDRTEAGGLLKMLEGVDLDTPVSLQGGQDFMFNNPGSVWASDRGPSSGILNAAKRAFERTGKSPLFLPYHMAPSGGDYATKTGETMLSYAASNMGKSDLKGMDKALRDIIPDWGSAKDGDALDIFRNTRGDQRKAALKVLDRDFRDRGGIGIGQARLAVTDPRQRNALDYHLRNVGEIDPLGKLLDTDHGTYSHGIPGRGLGELEKPMPALDLVPDFARSIGVTDTAKLDPKEAYTLRRNVVTGVLDDTLLKLLGE